MIPRPSSGKWDLPIPFRQGRLRRSGCGALRLTARWSFCTGRAYRLSGGRSGSTGTGMSSGLMNLNLPELACLMALTSYPCIPTVRGRYANRRDNYVTLFTRFNEHAISTGRGRGSPDLLSGRHRRGVRSSDRSWPPGEGGHRWPEWSTRERSQRRRGQPSVQ